MPGPLKKVLKAMCLGQTRDIQAAVFPAAAQGVICSGDPSAGFHWNAALMPIGTT